MRTLVDAAASAAGGGGGGGGSGAAHRVNNRITPGLRQGYPWPPGGPGRAEDLRYYRARTGLRRHNHGLLRHQMRISLRPAGRF